MIKMLKMTGTELELISDIDIHLFVEKGMRGGIFYIVKRPSKANNKYMQSYNNKKPSKYITYLDANNLYRWTMSQYIDFNTYRRKYATNSFKLMNNSVYGKTMENLRKRINFRLVNTAKDYKKYVSKRSFVSQKLLNKNVVAIHEIKSVLTLDKSIYVGFSILDLSKHLMYEFHYSYIKSKFNANLLLANTGTLVYEIETDDVNEDFYENKNWLDLSDFPQDSKFFDCVNKKVIGKMKDEINRN